MASIRDILENLPPHYEVTNVFVDGRRIRTTRFIKIDGQTAYFLNDSKLRIVKVGEISVIDFE